MAAMSTRNAHTLTGPGRAGLVLLTILGWLACTVAQVEKYVPPERAALVCLLGSCLVAATMWGLLRSYWANVDLPRWALPALFAVVALSFAVLYPKSLHHELRKGSDREDALRVELVAATHHQYPYDARTFRGNPPTPLPGALWLAFPFFLLGHVALQNLAWAAVFLVFLSRFFRRRSTAFAFVLIFLLTALENLNDFDVGGDYITNILYVSIAVFLFTRAVSRVTARYTVPGPDRVRAIWSSILAMTLLGVALSSRVIYVVVLVPLLAFTWQRTSPRRTALLFAGVLVAAATVTLPVFVPHPVSRILAQLAQNADKFNNLPVYIPGRLLPPVAIVAACSAFFFRMTIARVYLVSGISTLIMLLPPMAGIVASQGGLRRPLSPDIEYLAISVLFLGLWILSRWEQQVPASTVATSSAKVAR